MKDIMNKRFVFFDGTLMQGGAERVISILTRHMAEKGYKTEILLLHDREIFYDIDQRVNVTSVEKETRTTNFIKNLIWIRRYFKTNADIIVSFLAPFNIVALLAHLGLPSKIVVADRNDPRYVPANFFTRKLRDKLYLLADGVVLQTTKNKNYFSKKIREKSVVIANPIDLKDKAGQALRFNKEKEIVSVGRLMPQKNQMLILYAFGRIKDDYPDYSLVIYGEGPEREKLEKLSEELGIKERVHLPGSEKNVYDQISKSQVFILSSNYEGMPNALIEALCLGLPCITTNVSGVEDLIEPGVNGEVIPIGDVTALEKALRELLNNPVKRDDYGWAALRINDRLSVDKIMAQWIEYLASL